MDSAPHRTLLHQICIKKQRGKGLLTNYIRAIEKFVGGEDISLDLQIAKDNLSSPFNRDAIIAII